MEEPGERQDAEASADNVAGAQHVVTRAVRLDAPSDRVWEALADPDQRACWLAPESDFELAEGASGTLVDDDGVARTVRVGAVEPGERLTLEWWPTGSEGDATTVEFVLVGDGHTNATTLVVTETCRRRGTAVALANTRAVAAGAWAWSGRLFALGFVASTAVRM